MLNTIERWHLAEVAKNTFLANNEVVRIRAAKENKQGLYRVNLSGKYRAILTETIDAIVRQEVAYRYAEEQDVLKLWNWLSETTRILLSSQGFTIMESRRVGLTGVFENPVAEAEH